MNTILFKKDGIYVQFYNENIGSKDLRKLELDEFEEEYNSIAKFSDDLLVEDFMNCLYPFFDKIDSQFIAWSKGFQLIKYWEQMQKDIDPDDIEDNISHIQLEFISDLFDWEDLVHSKKHSNFSIYGSYSGINKDPNEPNYSMSITNINNWKHYPIKLSNELEIRKIDNEQKISTKMEWTLHDVIKWFLSELTFHGYPEDIIQFEKSLESHIEIAENEIGNAEYFTLDQLLLVNYKKQLEEAKAIENYEGMQKIQEKIDEILRNENK